MHRGDRSPGHLGLLVALCLIITAASAPTAAARDDWQLWLEQKWSVKLTSRVKLIGKSEERFNDDLGTFYKSTNHIGVSVKALAWLKVEPVYDYEWSEKTNGDTTIEHRLFLNVTPLWSWKRLHVEDRNRIEFRHINGVDDWRYRNKPKLGIELGSGWYEVEPYVADEVFYGARAGEWTRNRFVLGVEKPLTRRVSAELYYLIESNRQGRDWDEFHVLGFATTVAL